MTAASPTHHPLKPVLMLLLATLAWGLSFPLMKTLLPLQRQLAPGAGEWWLTAQSVAVRFGLAALGLALFSWRRLRRCRRLEWNFGIGIGLLTGGGMFFQMAGIGHTLASTSAFLTSAYVVIIPLGLALKRRTWPSRVLAGSCALVVAGLSVLSRVDWRHFHLGTGEWLTLLAALFFSAEILWLDRPEFAAADKFTGTVIMFATIAVLFLPAVLWTRTDCLVIYRSATVWGLLAGLVGLSTVLSFTLMNVWQPHLAPTHAGLIYCAEPVFASAFALVLPAWLARLGQVDYANESVTISLLVGGGLITLANVLAQFDR